MSWSVCILCFILEPASGLSITLPDANITPENGWLEDVFPIWARPIFRCYVSFREGIVRWSSHAISRYPSSALLGRCIGFWCFFFLEFIGKSLVPLFFWWENRDLKVTLILLSHLKLQRFQRDDMTSYFRDAVRFGMFIYSYFAIQLERDILLSIYKHTHTHTPYFESRRRTWFTMYNLLNHFMGVAPSTFLLSPWHVYILHRAKYLRAQ